MLHTINVSLPDAYTLIDAVERASTSQQGQQFNPYRFNAQVGADDTAAGLKLQISRAEVVNMTPPSRGRVPDGQPGAGSVQWRLLDCVAFNFDSASHELRSVWVYSSMDLNTALADNRMNQDGTVSFGSLALMNGAISGDNNPGGPRELARGEFVYDSGGPNSRPANFNDFRAIGATPLAPPNAVQSMLEQSRASATQGSHSSGSGHVIDNGAYRPYDEPDEHEASWDPSRRVQDPPNRIEVKRADGR